MAENKDNGSFFDDMRKAVTTAIAVAAIGLNMMVDFIGSLGQSSESIGQNLSGAELGDLVPDNTPGTKDIGKDIGRGG